MKSAIWFKGITISLTLVLGCFSLSIYLSSNGDAGASSGFTIGRYTRGNRTCVNWGQILHPSKLLGCATNSSREGPYQAVSLAAAPLVWNVVRDSKGHVTSSAGAAATMSNPAGTIAFKVAVTKKLYSSVPDYTNMDSSAEGLLKSIRQQQLSRVFLITPIWT